LKRLRQKKRQASHLPKKSKKPNAFQKLVKYLVACKGELKKITWPSPKQTTKNFGIVIAVIVVMGLFLFGLDFGLHKLLSLVMETSA
jgi:preprotein translocase subunit SecE